MDCYVRNCKRKSMMKFQTQGVFESGTCNFHYDDFVLILSRFALEAEHRILKLQQELRSLVCAREGDE